MGVRRQCRMIVVASRVVLASGLLALLVACAPVAAGRPNGESSAAKLVEYDRTGGFAGFDDHLVVRGDGSASIRRRGGAGEVAVDAKRLAHLRAALDEAQLPSLREEYLADGADMFTYRIVARGKTVTCMDSAVPPSVMPLLRILNDILDNAAVPPR